MRKHQQFYYFYVQGAEKDEEWETEEDEGFTFVGRRAKGSGTGGGK
jgi:hypothetical protein